MDATRKTEAWAFIPGYEGAYQASSLGRVRSVNRTIIRGGRPVRLRGVLLAQTTGNKGYKQVNLANGTTRRVHRLVAAAFLGSQDALQVRHLDGDPANNRLENLAYGTNAVNQQDSVRHGTHFLARQSECVNGHSLSGANLHVNPRGERVCRTCKRDRTRHGRIVNPATPEQNERWKANRRKPCRGCGLAKGAGIRRVYCATCAAARVAS